jgi:hypothetical protein
MTRFRLASGFSTAPLATKAGAEAAHMLCQRLGAEPALIFAYCTERLAVPGLVEAIRLAAPGAHIIGGTSVGGVMTEDGFHRGPSGAVALLGLHDPQGNYGVATAALEQALIRAGRPHEAPVAVWISQPPGEEEAILAGIQSVVGAKIPILGGSAADEEVLGNWREISTDGVHKGHVVVAVLFTACGMGTGFQGGHVSAGPSGVVTASRNRQILQIDHRPAAEVYAQWTGNAIRADEVGVILGKSATRPFGRIMSEPGGEPFYILTHPYRIGHQGEISVFTDIAQGERLYLMDGEDDALVRRSGVVVQDAHASGGWTARETLGGMVIYCGGCLLHVADRADEIAQVTHKAMNGAPFLGAFSYGEQGPVFEDSNHHANLMVCAMTLG